MKPLPIDIIPNTSPPRFRWRYSISTLDGMRTIECDGILSSTLEVALVELITLVKQQDQEICGLQKLNEGLAARITAQSELLGKKAESESEKQPPHSPKKSK